MDSFFDFARERHSIYLRRKEGQERPWTTDPILGTYRFTNVYRELDATTVWFRERVRDPLRNKPEVLLATVLFRWFNRIVTGEAIFCQLGDYANPGLGQKEGQATMAWSHFLRYGEPSGLRMAIRRYCGDGPYVTGAYIIKTPDGYDKLNGVLQCAEWFATQKHDGGGSDWGWRDLAQLHLDESGYNEHLTLEAMWNWLRKFPFLGDFMAYEIVTDLRHTALLERAPDIMTWANPGPGAMRGLNRLHGRDLNHRQHKHLFVCEMRDLLWKSQDPMNWPNNEAFPAWEMRDVEHTLCEFDKYERARLGEGRPRGVYR